MMKVAVAKAQQDAVPETATAPVAAIAAPPGAQVVPSTPAALKLSDLGSLLSFGTG